MRLLSVLKDLFCVFADVVLLAVLFPIEFDFRFSLIPSRATNGPLLVVESVAALSPAFLIRLLPFRPSAMLLPFFLSSVPGLLNSLAPLLSCVLRVSTFVLLLRLSFASARSNFVLPAIFPVTTDFFGGFIGGAGLALSIAIPAVDAEGNFWILLATREVFAEVICLCGSVLVLVFTAGGADFGLLIFVAIREVLALFVLAFCLSAGLVFVTAAGALAGRTVFVMIEVFGGLTRFGVAGAGEGLDILRAGATLRGGDDAVGGAGRCTGWLGLDERLLTFAGGGLVRRGRVDVLGAGWGLLGCAGLAAGALFLLAVEGPWLLGAGDDF